MKNPLFFLLLYSWLIFSDRGEAIINCISQSKTQAIVNYEESFNNLAVDRRSTIPYSNMTTLTLENFVYPGALYEFSSERNRNQRSSRYGLDRREELQYTVFRGHWNKDFKNPDDTNILGDTGSFNLNTFESVINIPIVTATEASLSYYKAHLLEAGTQFEFNINKPFPIFIVEIGEHYVKDFLFGEQKGVYLERHNTPHYHEPLDEDSRGFYVLAKEVSANEYHITGFKVPYGSAIYTEPNAIHNDAYTIGKWRVGYVNADEYSTVLLKNLEETLVGLRGKE